MFDFLNLWSWAEQERYFPWLPSPSYPPDPGPQKPLSNVQNSLLKLWFNKLGGKENELGSLAGLGAEALLLPQITEWP
jgi:hypothetical protein